MLWSFFKKINVDGIAFLKGLIGSDPPSFETDWLDFKGGEQLKDKDVKKICIYIFLERYFCTIFSS